jgi:hypothetical protein
MTPIDYLLLTGAAAAGAYVVTRLFVGWRRSLTTDYQADRPQMAKESAPPDRVSSTHAPWQPRK